VIFWRPSTVLQEFDAMTAPSSLDPTAFLHEQLAQASPDLLRQMLTAFINTLMSAEADAVCGAGYGERSEARTNSRNGYLSREFDTRAGGPVNDPTGSSASALRAEPGASEQVRLTVDDSVIDWVWAAGATGAGGTAATEGRGRRFIDQPVKLLLLPAEPDGRPEGPPPGDTDPHALRQQSSGTRGPRATHLCGLNPHQVIAASPDTQDVLISECSDQDREPSHFLHHRLDNSL
jgi:hypothetical protein